MLGAIAEAVAAEPVDLLRATLLPARVEIALAAGDHEAARAAASELSTISETFGTTALAAATACAEGAIEVAEGEANAVSSLRRGANLWQEIGVPYEAARARVLLAQALLARGDAEAAALELRAARRVFERLGATPDARGATEVLRALPGADDDRSTTEKTFHVHGHRGIDAARGGDRRRGVEPRRQVVRRGASGVVREARG